MTELKIKNRQIPGAVAVLGQLALEKKIPAKLRWQAVRLKGDLQTLLEALGKAETELVREYATTTPEGELIPSRDRDGKEVQGTWSFQDPTPAFESEDGTANEPAELRAKRLEALGASVREFQTRHTELMVIENNVVGTQFSIEDFELSELSGEQLNMLDFLITG